MRATGGQERGMELANGAAEEPNTWDNGEMIGLMGRCTRW